MAAERQVGRHASRGTTRSDDSTTSRRVLISLISGLTFAASLLSVVGYSARDVLPLDSWLGITKLTSSRDASPLVSGGWGPSREVFTIDDPPEYVVMNSIVDNPAVGDERNFVQIRHVGDSNELYADRLHASVGDTLVVFVWVSNDASDFVDSEPASIQGLSARLYVGDTEKSEVPLSVKLSAKNATEVWDGVLVTVPIGATIEYLPGSATFHTNDPEAGSYVVPDVDFGNGGAMSIGYSAPDGELPVGYGHAGDYRGHGYLTFRVTVVS